MRNITEFIGIIRGISFDGVINEKEIQHLEKWLSKNKNLIYETEEVKLLKLVETALEDGIIDEKERVLMNEHAEILLKSSKNSDQRSHELNGIIGGIVCDKEINDMEIYRLKAWVDAYSEDIKDHEASVTLIKMINNILSDGVITGDEKQELLNMLQERITESKIEIKLEYLCNLVKERKNIGVELIDILDDEKAMQIIHYKAECKLLEKLNKYSNLEYFDSEIIVVSLVLIAMLEYDGSYYDSVRETYKTLYEKRSEQKIEGLIRGILGKYKNSTDIKDRGRLINVALENAIVPKAFLVSYFEFIYDIYKLNFECELSNELYADLKFVFEGLKMTIEDDKDELSLKVTQKTYKLIAATKKMFSNEDGLDAIIKLSILVIKIIDKRYWNKDLNVYNPYLKSGFEGWNDQFQKESNGHRRSKSDTHKSHSRWEPKFMCINKNIYLIPPTHRVKGNYNYREIEIVVENNSQVIYKNNNCDIREVIGGYKIDPKEIVLEKPLGEVVYKLIAADEIIYDSRKKLHRSLIVFDEKGEELSNNTDYEGSAFFVCNHVVSNLQIVHNTENYSIAHRIVKTSDLIHIGDYAFSFSRITNPGVFGEFHNKTVLCESESEKELQVYKEVQSIVFEINDNSGSIEILINETRLRLSSLKYVTYNKGGRTKYVVDIDLPKSDIYKIEVIQIVNGKKVTILKKTIAYDKELKYSFNIQNSKEVEVFIESGLLDENLNIKTEVDRLNTSFVSVVRNSKTYYYEIVFDFGFINIDRQNWKSKSEGIWIDDVKYNSTLSLYDSECDGLTVYSDKGKILDTDIIVKNKKNYLEVEIGFLNSYKHEHKYVQLVFTKEEENKHIIRCFNNCILDERRTDIIQLDAKHQVRVIPVFYGKNNVYFEINDHNGELIYKSEELKSGESAIIEGVNSFEEYIIKFYEKRKMQLYNKKEVLMQKSHKFYFSDTFQGRTFKIKTVAFEQFYYGKLRKRSCNLFETFVKFEKRVCQDKFTGEILVQRNKKIYQLHGINPVEIEICSEVVNGILEVYITNNGDGLLIDFDRKKIINTLDHSKAPDIVNYILDMESEGII